MSIFLTGATGFVGKHVLYTLLKDTNHTIVIPIRSKKNISAEDRYTKEIASSPFFSGVDLSRVTLIPKDIESLDADDLKGVKCFVHCAAVVKFNQPLEILLKENYESVKKLFELCKGIKFIYISTCYVHPKYLQHPGKAEVIEKGLPREAFICDYAYTKYLAEQYLYEQTAEIDIVRLSCVGAPLDDLSPMRGAAHLGILEIGYRRTLSDAWFPDTLEFSVVPVDIVANHVVETIQTDHKGLRIQQYSAPVDSKTYNISAKELAAPIFEEMNITYWKGLPYETFVFAMTCLYFWIPSTLDKILEVNYIISSVSNNISFESSIELPPISKEHYLNRTRDYVHRLVQEHPKPLAPWKDLVYSMFLVLKKWLVHLLLSLTSK